MNFHNPSAVPDSIVGPNHRLLTQDELDKPLPEGAEFWCIIQNKWKTAEGDEQRHPYPTFNTYRIPLTLSDKMKQERDRLDEQIRIVEAVENGTEWEFLNSEGWYQPHNQGLSNFENVRGYGHKIRLKPIPPTPSSIPWTLETRPLTEVWIRPKSATDEEYHVHRWNRKGGFLSGIGFVTYFTLHSDWLQRNGEPAGEKVTV